MNIKHEKWGIIIKLPKVDIEIHRNEDGDLVSLSLTTNDGGHTVDVRVVENDIGNQELFGDGVLMGGL